MNVITSATKVSEENLPIALALYINRDGIMIYPWDEVGCWQYRSGSGKNTPVVFVKCSFLDALAAFLMGEISDYFGDWVSGTLEQVGNCNNGHVFKAPPYDEVKHRTITVLSRDELDILVEQGFNPVGYEP